MRVKYLALSLLMTLAACGQTPTGTAPTAGAPGLSGSLPATPAQSGKTTLRPLAVQTSTLVGWYGGGAGEFTIPTGLTNPKAIAAGEFFSLALQKDGTVVGWAWDSRGDGQATVPDALKDPLTAKVTAIAAGRAHSLALQSDGTVVAWGDNSFGKATVPDDLKDPLTAKVTAIAAGSNSSLALKNDGTVVGWGWEAYATVPDALKDPATAHVTAIVPGPRWSLALKQDGTVVGWGADPYTNDPFVVPDDLTNPLTAHVTAIAAGTQHSLALKSDGTVVAWFNGSKPSSMTNVPADLTGVTAIAAGNTSSLALKNDGTVVSWGTAYTTVPADLTYVTAIASGYYHNLALRTLPDTTPPVITANTSSSFNEAGWYNTPVTVSWTVEENESDISSRTGCDATTLSADTTGTTLTCTATSAGGTGSESITVKLDKTPPTLAPVLSSTQPVLLGGSLSVTPNASDATSGVASSSCPAPDTSTVGNKTLTCTATDNAGNTQTATVNYSVIYAFTGFSTVSNFPTLNTVRVGSLVTLNFKLAGESSTTVLAVGYPKVTPVGCTVTTPTAENATTLGATSTKGLTYSRGTYSYIWRASGRAGECLQFNLRLKDGTDHYALFKLR